MCKWELGQEVLLPEQFQLENVDFHNYCQCQPASLFVQNPPAYRQTYLNMPRDPMGYWLQHYSSTGAGRHADGLPLSALPLKDIISVSQGTTFLHLAAVHYWLYPILEDEEWQCSCSVNEFGFAIWDTLHRIPCSLMLPPSSSLPDTMSPTTTAARSATLPTLPSSPAVATRFALSPLARCWYPESPHVPECHDLSMMSTTGTHESNSSTYPIATAPNVLPPCPTTTATAGRRPSETHPAAVPHSLPPLSSYSVALEPLLMDLLACQLNLFRT